jgi:NTP pyrophosphatase (non-canonical NTP hydrolase)
LGVVEVSYPIDLNDIAHRQWEWCESLGWHNKTTLECLALIASEVGEAINEARVEPPTDHFAEELADIILRTVDLAETHKINIQQAVLNKLNKNESVTERPKGKDK